MKYRGNYRGGERGTTLIEVLISTAIFSFVVIAVFLIFRMGTQYWITIKHQKALQDSLSYASEDIYKELKQTKTSLVFYIESQYCNSTGDPDIRRDILYFASNSNWYDKDSYDSDGKPLWDRFIAYVPTQPSCAVSDPNDLVRNVYGALYKVEIVMDNLVSTDTIEARLKNTDLSTQLVKLRADLTSDSGSVETSLSNIEQKICGGSNCAERKTVKRIIPPPYSETLGNVLFSFEVLIPRASSVGTVSTYTVYQALVPNVSVLIDLRQLSFKTISLSGSKYFKVDSVRVNVKAVPQF